MIKHNKMSRLLKTLIIILTTLWFNTNIQAQDGIDTALFKQYKVKKMWVWVKLPILPSRTLDDSCKAEIYEIDTFTRITYQNKAMNCYGWGGSSESYNTYDTLDRIILSKTILEEEVIYSKYFYNAKNDILKIVQTSLQKPDSFVINNFYIYNSKGKVSEMKNLEIIGSDTTKYITKYNYDKADNIKTIWTYTGDLQLIQKQNFEITPISKKILEFSTETKLPKESFTRGWNYYNFDAQLSRTQYSNNTWTEFVYKDNGLLDQTLSYNMQGKLNSWKRYYYEFYESGE